MSISEMSISERAAAFAVDLYGCNTLEACRDLFKDAILPSGFDTFACGEVDLVKRERTVIYIMKWPDRWRDFYLSSGLVERDPVIEELKHRKTPFQWSELRKDLNIGRAGRDVLELFLKHGWSEGLVVPLQRSETQYGLISLVGSGPDLTKPQRDALTAMSIALYEKARRIASGLGVHVQIAGLTLREMDVIRLVGRGMTDREIGTALNISPGTAHEYVENAKRKLRTRSRSEAVAVAISMGLV